MAKTISDLRDYLFQTLEDLKDRDKPLDTDRAQAVIGVAQTIIESAKLEVALVRATDGDIKASTFFKTEPNDRLAQLQLRGPARAPRPELPPGKTPLA